jgi:hypothetical protein
MNPSPSLANPHPPSRIPAYSARIGVTLTNPFAQAHASVPSGSESGPAKVMGVRSGAKRNARGPWEGVSALVSESERAGWCSDVAPGPASCSEESSWWCCGSARLSMCVSGRRGVGRAEQRDWNISTKCRRGKSGKGLLARRYNPSPRPRFQCQGRFECIVTHKSTERNNDP